MFKSPSVCKLLIINIFFLSLKQRELVHCIRLIYLFKQAPTTTPYNIEFLKGQALPQLSIEKIFILRQCLMLQFRLSSSSDLQSVCLKVLYHSAWLRNFKIYMF